MKLTKTDVRAYFATYVSIQLLGLAMSAPMIVFQVREPDLLLLAVLMGFIFTILPTLIYALLIIPMAKVSVTHRESTWWLLGLSSMVTILIFLMCLFFYDALMWDETIAAMLGSALLAGGTGALVARRVYLQANEPIIYKAPSSAA